MLKILNNSCINKNMLNWFSFGIIIVFLIILSWFTYDKYKDFITYNKNISLTAIVNAEDAISISLKTKKRFLKNFVSEHRAEIIRLIDNPNNTHYFNSLHASLKKYLPELFTINIFTKKSGMLIDDHDGFVGKLCQNDLNQYYLKNQYKKRTHPNAVLYHYDEISELTYNDTKYLFFASFSLKEIATTLQHSTPRNHNFIIMNKHENNLIEITKAGGRDKQKYRANFRLTTEEISRITTEIGIPETFWSIADIENPDINKQFLFYQIISYSIIFIFISFVIFIMKNFINKNFFLLSSLNSQLILKNNEITTLNAELKDVATKDSLTKIFNRRYFDKQLNKEWNRSTRTHNYLGLLMIDIDFFKEFNDQYGHIEGDNCLIKVAEIIDSCFYRSNEFIARYGGEEFVGVVNGNLESCLTIAKHIHDKLKTSHIEHIKSGFNIISVSIGIASLIADKGIKPIKLIEQADKALYLAKENGRNQTQVYDERNQ